MYGFDIIDSVVHSRLVSVSLIGNQDDFKGHTDQEGGKEMFVNLDAVAV